MPLGRILHEADSLALGGARDDHRRAPMELIRKIERVQYFRHVVAVDLEDMPVECRPFFRDRLGGHYRRGGARLLHAVVVDDDSKVAQSELAGHQETFPNDSGIEFAIPQNDVDPAARTRQAGA